MQTALRKMGNSTGIIVPRPLLAEMGVANGAAMDVRVEDGKLIATPIATPARAGWKEAAEAIAGDAVEEDWLAMGNDGDDELTW